MKLRKLFTKSIFQFKEMCISFKTKHLISFSEHLQWASCSCLVVNKMFYASVWNDTNLPIVVLKRMGQESEVVVDKRVLLFLLLFSLEPTNRIS